MSENPSRNLPLVPFVIADVLFLAMAGAILAFSHRPLLWWEACLMVGCGSAAALSLTTPLLRMDRNQQSNAQAARLADVASELRELQELAGHIRAATSQWKSLEAHTGQSLESAKQLADSLAAESRSLAEALQKAGDGEKAQLRLEVEKLRRHEGESVQTVTRILDHVFALFQAAQRSGQRGLIEQITLFQDSCREAARRIGLLATKANPADLFDSRLHQLRDNSAAPDGAVIAEVLATGFTYQGQLVRRALVSIAASPSPTSQQDDLPMVEEAQP